MKQNKKETEIEKWAISLSRGFKEVWQEFKSVARKGDIEELRIEMKQWFRDLEKND